MPYNLAEPQFSQARHETCLVKQVGIIHSLSNYKMNIIQLRDPRTMQNNNLQSMF